MQGHRRKLSMTGDESGRQVGEVRMPMGIQSRRTYNGLVSSETASREKEARLLVNTGDGEREWGYL